MREGPFEEDKGEAAESREIFELRRLQARVMDEARALESSGGRPASRRTRGGEFGVVSRDTETEQLPPSFGDVKTGLMRLAAAIRALEQKGSLPPDIMSHEEVEGWQTRMQQLEELSSGGRGVPDR